MQLVCNRNHSSSKIPPDFAATMFEANSSAHSWGIKQSQHDFLNISWKTLNAMDTAIKCGSRGFAYA